MSVYSTRPTARVSQHPPSSQRHGQSPAPASYKLYSSCSTPHSLSSLQTHRAAPPVRRYASPPLPNVGSPTFTTLNPVPPDPPPATPCRLWLVKFYSKFIPGKLRCPVGESARLFSCVCCVPLVLALSLAGTPQPSLEFVCVRHSVHTRP